MKIIIVDNFASETTSDELLAADVSEFWAERIAEAMNEKYSGPTAHFFARVVPDDYVLFVYEP